MKTETDHFVLEDVRSLAQVMKDFDLAELELSRGSGERLHLVRGRAGASDALLGAAAAVHHSGGEAHTGHGAAPHGRGAPCSAGPPSALGTASASVPASSAGHDQPQNLFVVSAPLVGTFYRAAGPDASPFVEIGQRVRRGQPLCIIEAMKLMNELESEVDGTVVACLADNGRPVEYGQPLFHIERHGERHSPQG